jgi:hypothetical protein
MIGKAAVSNRVDHIREGYRLYKVIALIIVGLALCPSNRFIPMASQH